jgi:hypothetical protein
MFLLQTSLQDVSLPQQWARASSTKKEKKTEMEDVRPDISTQRILPPALPSNQSGVKVRVNPHNEKQQWKMQTRHLKRMNNPPDNISEAKFTFISAC